MLCSRRVSVCVHRDSLVSPLAGQVQWCEGVVVCGINRCSFMHQHIYQLGLA